MLDLAARLDRLERTNRRWRALALAGGLGCALALLGGAVLAARRPAPAAAADLVRTRSLEVVGNDNRVLVSIKAGHDDRPSIAVYDADNGLRAYLRLHDEATHFSLSPAGKAPLAGVMAAAYPDRGSIMAANAKGVDERIESPEAR